MDDPSLTTRGVLLRPHYPRVQTTLGELLKTHPDPTWRQDLPRAVYVVRDGEQALYVGKTKKGARARLQAHIGQKPGGGYLGRAYYQDEPVADAWTVEVIYIRSNLDEAERFYIARLRPKYNQQRPPPSRHIPFELPIEYEPILLA